MASSLRLVVRLLTYLAVANAASQPHIVYFLVDDLGYANVRELGYLMEKKDCERLLALC